MVPGFLLQEALAKSSVSPPSTTSPLAAAIGQAPPTVPSAQQVPQGPYSSLAPLATASGSRRSTSYYENDARVNRFFGENGVGYHLPVAALADDQIWSDTWPMPYVGPLSIDNQGCGQPIETPEMRRQYRELYRKEPSVRAAIKGKNEAVAVLDISVLPQDKHNDLDCQAAEFVKWTVENTLLGWDGLITQIVTPALIDGFSVLEKTLIPIAPERSREWAGKWGLLHCRGLDTHWLRLQLDQYRNVLSVVNMVRGLQYYNVDKCILFSYSSLWNNPFGQSDLRACIRSCGLIQDAYQLWYLALKLFGMPYLVGKVSIPAQREMMEQALADLRAGGYCVTGVEDEVELLNLTSGTSFGAFEANINKMREDNFMAIRGAYLPFLEGQGGPDARGNTEVSKVASDGNSDLLAKAVARVLTHQLVPWLVRDNFPKGTGYPTVVLGGTNLEETSKQLDIALTLAKEFGQDISKDQLYERAGWSPPDGPEDVVNINQIEAANQLAQGKVQLQLQAAGQQQQMAMQAQMQQMQPQQPPGGGGGQPPAGGGGGGGGSSPSAPPQGGGQGQFELGPAQQFSEGSKTSKFSCVFAPLSEKLADHIKSFQKQIKEADLADDGFETEPHVTVRYGLHGDDADEVSESLKGSKPFEVKFDNPSVFSGGEGKDYDVIKLDILDSSKGDLVRLHRRLGDLPHTDTHKDYHPHATIAYVKKGKGKEYVAKMHYPRKTFSDTITELVFSDQNHDKTTIPLGKKPEAKQFSADITPDRFAALASSMLADLAGVRAFADGDRHDLGETIRQGVENSARVPPTGEFVQDATAGKVLADALDDSGQPHAPFYRNLVHSGSPIRGYQSDTGKHDSATGRMDSLADHDAGGSWMFRNTLHGPFLIVHRRPHGRPWPTHTAVLHAPALREWAAHPAISPTLRAHLLNAAEHLEGQEKPPAAPTGFADRHDPEPESGGTPTDPTHAKLRKAVDADPDNAEAHAALADHLDQIGQSDEAAFHRAMAYRTAPGAVPEALDLDDVREHVPTAVPTDSADKPDIPELEGRKPTHNEEVAIAGQPVYVGSTNVSNVWWNWKAKRLFVRFLDGSLYSYEDVPLPVATGMIQSDSPGRYVWNVLRADGYDYHRLSKGAGGKRKPQVIRKHSEFAEEFAAKPVVPQPDYPDIVHHAAAALDNPLDKTAIQSFADHLSEAYPQDPHAESFRQWAGGQKTWPEIGPSMRGLPIHPNGASHNQDSTVGGAYIHLTPMQEGGRRRDEEAIAAAGGRISRVAGSPTWEIRRPAHIVRWLPHPVGGGSTYRRAVVVPKTKMNSLQVAHHLLTTGGPGTLAMAVIGANHFHPDRVPDPNVGQHEVKLSEMFADPAPGADLGHTPLHTQAEFHHTLVHAPEDKTAALVYADWLQDQGKEAHAEVVRMHAANRFSPGTERLSYHPGEVANFHPGQFYASAINYAGPQVAINVRSESPHSESPGHAHILTWRTGKMDPAARDELLSRIRSEGSPQMPQVEPSVPDTVGMSDEWKQLDRHPETGRWHKPGTLEEPKAETFAAPPKPPTPSPEAGGKPNPWNNMLPKTGREEDASLRPPMDRPLPAPQRLARERTVALPPASPVPTTPEAKKRVANWLLANGPKHSRIMPGAHQKSPAPAVGAVAPPAADPYAPPAAVPATLPTAPSISSPSVGSSSAAPAPAASHPMDAHLEQPKVKGAIAQAVQKFGGADPTGLQAHIRDKVRQGMAELARAGVAGSKQIEVNFGGKRFRMTLKHTPNKRFYSDAADAEMFSLEYAEEPDTTPSWVKARKTFAEGTSDLGSLLASARANPHDAHLHGAIADALDEAHPGNKVSDLIRRQYGQGQYGGQGVQPDVYTAPFGEFPTTGRNSATRRSAALGNDGPFQVVLRHHHLPVDRGGTGEERWAVHALMPADEAGHRVGYTFEFPHERAHEIPQMFPGTRAENFISGIETKSPEDRAREAELFATHMAHEEGSR